jgi:hypothetical protein
MNGVVFQTSTAMTAARAVSGEAVQAIGSEMRPTSFRTWLSTPKTSLNIHAHIWAETTSGWPRG